MAEQESTTGVVNLCQCGCGQPAPVAKRTQRKRGYVAGQPCRFIVGHNHVGIVPANRGYKMKRAVGHPKANSAGNVYAHVLIAERALGKPLPLGALVHHADEDPQHNANSNLVICQDRAYHRLLHVRARMVRAGANPNTERVCTVCRRALPFSAFSAHRASKSYGLSAHCRECARVKWAAFDAKRRERAA